MTISDAAIDRLIELARWAPSGDNTQPWRFERVAADHLVIHGFDTRDHCVYDLDGHPSQLAIGAMIETMHIAASEQALVLKIKRRPGPPTNPTFDIHLTSDNTVGRHALLPAIPRRTVQRRALATKALSATEVATLSASLSPGYSVLWYASLLDRWRMANLMFANAKLRLTLREAYDVHSKIIAWSQRFSQDRVPDQALGVDPLTLKLMRWVLASWPRVQFMNKWMAGTLVPRIQMDFLPSIRCAAHFAILASRAPAGVDDYIAAGREVQRFWLTATSLGLQHQPEVTPLVFSRYIRNHTRFTECHNSQELAQHLERRTRTILDADPSSVIWIGRIGHGAVAESRSLRLPLEALTQTETQTTAVDSGRY